MTPVEKFQKGELILIDKPLRWTSFDAVNKIRYALKRNFQIKKIKVGHAGTLDPLATGLVLICTGKMTKQINDFMNLPKVYTGTITLGITTPSFDLETQPDGHFSTGHISTEDILQCATTFEGEINQVPPQYSAIKSNGVKAYEAARQGKEITMKSRTVYIKHFKITAINMPNIYFEVNCSKGTYIRSLAHDMGKALGSGAHLSALRRQAIGEYNVYNALSPEAWVGQLESETNP